MTSTFYVSSKVGRIIQKWCIVVISILIFMADFRVYKGSGMRGGNYPNIRACNRYFELKGLY